MFNKFDEGMNTYGYTVTAQWDYTHSRPYIGDSIKDKRRIYIHYYSIETGSDEELAFDKRISGLCRELLDGRYIEAHKNAYQQFFEVNDTPVRGRHVCYKEDTIKESKKYLGYFTLITNEKMDTLTSLHLYRMKDIIKKGFGNLNERLNIRKLLVASEK